MLRITAVSAGSVEYLLRGSGCAGHEHARDLDAAPGISGPERAPAATAEYFGRAIEHGEAPGRWGGRGLALVGMEPGAVARADDVRAIFGQLTHPDGQQLGRAAGKYRSTAERVAAALEAEPDATPERRREIELGAAADGRKGVAYYDLTFSPPKSVSVYYAALLAAGDVEGAAQVVRAHERAVETAMAYAEDHIAWTRTGYHGRTADGRSVGKYEATNGLIWSAWKHSTNREAEPQIHTHVGLLNRAETTSDGKVRALDGRGFRPVKEALATAYERALEQEVVAARGVVFGDRADGKAREIVGVDPQLCASASTRRAQVLARSGELTDDYVARHGRQPGPGARKHILQQATLQTRQPKSGPAGPEAVAVWAQTRQAQLAETLEAVAAAGEAAAAGMSPDVVLGHRLDPEQPEQRQQLLAAAVADVQRDYATWTVGNLVAAIDKRVGELPAGMSGTARPAYLEALAQEAVATANGHGVALLSVADPVAEIPAEYRRAEDGRSVFRPHNDARYATWAQLQAEERIVAGARQLTAPAVALAELARVREELAAVGLSADQVDAVAGIVGSGRAGDVLVGPAGTGKSRTVGALAQVWTAQVGGRVLGLATSQAAAQVLADDGLQSMNTAAFLARYAPDEHGRVRERVRAGDLYVVDEAGMSSTAELDQISAIVREGGAKMLYTGDPHQLTSIGAGGALALLASDNGAYQLEQVHRMRHGWEREASLRLRAGDRSVITEYEDRGRLHGGTREEMQAAALRAYLADTLAGRESLLIVGTNTDAAMLSQEIRERLIAAGRVEGERLAELGPLAGWAGVSVGDVVQARRGDWSIPVQGGPKVANRAVYEVLGREPDGSLRVRGTAGEIALLPASYVAQHVTLAYASTVHAAQGRSVYSSHGLLDEAAAREAAYVLLTRGIWANHAYLIAVREPDAHEVERLDSTAAGRLAAVLGNVEARPAAEVERRAGIREGQSLAWVGGQWDVVARDAARDRYTDALLHIVGPEALDTLTAEHGWPRLLRAVREAELAGHHGPTLLADAVAVRSLGDADSVSDVLRWRVRAMTLDRVPEQRVEPGDWSAYAPPTDGPVGQFAHELAVLSGDRQYELGQAALADPPSWAVEQLGPAPAPTPPADSARGTGGDVDERERWARRAGAVAAYRELAGISPEVASIGAAPSREQELHHRMWTAAAVALGRPADAVDYAAAADLDLYALREQWARAQAIAPPYVAQQMRAAYELADEYAADATLASARLATLEPTDPGWEPAAAQIERSQRLAQLYAAQADALEQQHRTRADWYDRTTEIRTADELARVELARRDLPERRHDPILDEEVTRMRQPEVDGPEVDGPEVDVPEVDVPEVDGPEVDGPEVDGPEVGERVVGEPEPDRPVDDERVVDRSEDAELAVDEPDVDRRDVDRREVDRLEVAEPEVDRREVDVPEVDEREVDGPDVAEREVEVSEVAEPEVEVQRARAALDEARRVAEVAEREQIQRAAADAERQAQAEAARLHEVEAQAAREEPEQAQREQQTEREQRAGPSATAWRAVHRLDQDGPSLER